MFDLTVLAFNVADRYRLPVLLLGDEVVGHMVERVVIPPAAQIERWERKRPAAPPNGRFDAFRAEDEDLVPPIAHAGEGYRVHYTGLTHDPRGYPDMSAETHHELVSRLVAKVNRNAPAIIRTEEYHLEGARILVIAYGCTARSARSAVRRARAQGIPVGLLRPITVSPFPFEKVASLVPQADAFLVVEMSTGQMLDDVSRSVGGRIPIDFYGRLGGVVPFPDEVLDEIHRVASNPIQAGQDPREAWLQRLKSITN